jgi:exopolyphosphatase / guanosine-5'-triphosphate,3'-diphosphate pyrophosphatase
MASSDDSSLRIAAIDVGSNSIHMVVAQADSDGAVTNLWRLKEPVGLGRISFPSRKLTREAMDRAIATLGRFQQAANQRNCEKIVAIATSAIREAENGGDFILRAKEELKLFIRVVTAREEARLIYLGVRHSCRLDHQPHLIVDIGGGSVEFIVGDSERASLLESRKLGAARMTAKFVRSDPIASTDLSAMRRHFDRELAKLADDIERAGPTRAVGSSGTLENVAAMCGGIHPKDDDGFVGVIERKPLQKLLEKLHASDSASRTAIKGLDDGRRDQIVAGATLVGDIFERLGLKKMHLSPAALREGILVDYLQRHLPELAIRRDVPDPRRRSVLDLARRCDWHETHSRQVAKLALRLFDELHALHGLVAGDRELLEYAALLHDIGWHIAGSGHHRHSLYLILHGQLKGFTPAEIGVIANTARYHRKALPDREHEAYMALPPADRKRVRHLAALLRVADGLDRSHGGVVTDLKCRVDADQVRLKLITRADAELEVWGAGRKADLFRAAYKRPISIGE